MKAVKCYPLNLDAELHLAPAYRPPAELLPQIAAIWEREQQKHRPALTDGRIYCLVQHAPDRLTIAPSHYRYLLARRRHPELAALGLEMRALAVTGVLLCAGGVVLGRRGQCVTSDAGLWEAAPAGGLSQPDPARQLLDEAQEEIGLPSRLVRSAKMTGLVEDCASGVVDIVFIMQTDLDEKGVRSLHTRCRNGEYETIAIVPIGSLPAFLEENSAHLLPALIPMLSQSGILS